MDYNKPNVVWITTISKTLLDSYVYGKCLSTWNHILDRKILFAEDGATVDGFEIINIDELMDLDWMNARRPNVHRRFYRKAFAIYWALKNINADYIAWLDADVEVLKDVDKFIEFNEPYASMFRESRNSVETGLLVFNTKTLPESFADKWIAYWHDNIIATLETGGKDTHVLMDLGKQYPAPHNFIYDESITVDDANDFDRTYYKGYFKHWIGKSRK